MNRVPTIVVSPWSAGGYVCSEVFDHTSTLRLLERRFGVRETNISDWRRTICSDLTSAFRPYDGGQVALPTPTSPWKRSAISPCSRSRKNVVDSSHARPARYAP